MNRIVKVFCLGCFVLLLVLSLPTFSTAEMARPKNVTLKASAGPSGTEKDISTRLVCEAVRKGNPDWVVDVINGPTPIAEVSMMGRGEMDLARLEMSDVIHARKGFYGPQKLSAPVEMAWLFPLTKMDVTMYAREQVPFNSITELRAKKYPLKVSIGRKGSGPYNMNIEVLKAYGITPADIERWGGKVQYQPTPVGSQMMQDGLIDAIIMQGPIVASAIEDLSRNVKLKAIYLSEPDIQAKLRREGYSVTQVSAGIYKFVTEKTSTMGKAAPLMTSRKMKDEVAYHLVRSVWEQREYLFAANPKFKPYLQPETIKSWVAEYGDILHPGAAKYWQEKGFMK